MKINFEKEKTIEFIKKRKIEIIIIFVVLAIIVVGVILITNKNKNIAGNSISNLQNKGIAAIKGSTAYYTKLNGDNTAIYKLNLNSNKETRIKYTEGFYLNVYKESLYYLEQNDETNTFNLIKSKLDGSEREKLVKEIDGNRVTVVDDWAYYFKDKVLYRTRTNGKDNMKVLEDAILNYGVNNNYIYYIYNNGEKNVLARRNLNDGIFLKLAENVSKDFEIIGNKIYFIEQKYNSEEYQYNYSLYRMKLDGGGRKQIFSLPRGIDNINITKDAIYYTIQNGTPYNIYKHKFKDSEHVLLKEVSTKTEISVLDNWIFYLDLNDNNEVETYRIKGE